MFILIRVNEGERTPFFLLKQFKDFVSKSKDEKLIRVLFTSITAQNTMICRYIFVHEYPRIQIKM